LERRDWIETIIPAFILFALWLDGWFFPLILLPVLYVLYVEKKDLAWIGFSTHNAPKAILCGIAIASVLGVIYYPIFLYYSSGNALEATPDLYVLFLDLLWYPLYEEVAYRGFALAHFAVQDEPSLSRRNTAVNLFQSLFFIAIHRHHFSTPLVLVPVFALAFLNGLLFLRKRNLFGCIVSHSLLNSFGWFLRLYVT